MEPISTTDRAATDEVIDAIAEIEVQRRETEKTAGLPLSCSSALHRLNELLDHETEALRLRGPGTGHAENTEAVQIEMARVKALAEAVGKSTFPGAGHNGYRRVIGEQRSWRDAPRNPPRNKGRRTMGRTGGG